jgi:catechol 2,3-dioxygenase-like lactoylglutathione lyase family enzyme
MAGPRIIGAAHLVPVSNLDASVGFYVGTLGFAVVIRSDTPAFVKVRRDGLMVGLQGGMAAEVVELTGQVLAVQVWVDDLTALWEELEPGLDALPAGRVRPPFLQPYGVREFHVKDPDGFLMLFSEAADAGLAT